MDCLSLSRKGVIPDWTNFAWKVKIVNNASWIKIDGSFWNTNSLVMLVQNSGVLQVIGIERSLIERIWQEPSKSVVRTKSAGLKID